MNAALSGPASVEPGRERGGSPDGLDRWWLRAAELSALAPRALTAPQAAYRLGDATLEIAADDPEVLESLQQLYSECAIETGEVPAALRVRCSLDALDGLGLTLVRFEGAEGLDLAELALPLVQPRPDESHRVIALGASGWRALVGVAPDAVPVLAARGSCLLAETARLPAFFFRDYLLGAALSVQRHVLFVHAASVAVHGRGALIVGRAGGGKTTLSLALAARGHGLLGDDMAALRTESRELLPFRRTVHIRSGLRDALVDEAIRRGRVAETERAGARRLCAEPRGLFPDAPAQPVRLRAAFFLRRFSRAPSLEPFVPSLDRIAALKTLPVRWSWGIAPGGRLLRFLRIIRLLSEVPCWQLDVGRPAETASLMEAALEDL